MIRLHNPDLSQIPQELLLVYHASEVDEGHCLGFPSPLACLVLLTGEEILRQRLQR